MKIREFFPDDFGATALQFTMWLAVIGFVAIVGVAIMSLGSS